MQTESIPPRPPSLAQRRQRGVSHSKDQQERHAGRAGQPELDRVTAFGWIGQVPGQILKPCSQRCCVQVSGGGAAVPLG
jgi:hypothetical protein